MLAKWTIGNVSRDQVFVANNSPARDARPEVAGGPPTSKKINAQTFPRDSHMPRNECSGCRAETRSVQFSSNG